MGKVAMQETANAGKIDNVVTHQHHPAAAQRI
jgi:hypothetical protein